MIGKSSLSTGTGIAHFGGLSPVITESLTLQMTCYRFYSFNLRDQWNRAPNFPEKTREIMKTALIICVGLGAVARWRPFFLPIDAAPSGQAQGRSSAVLQDDIYLKM